MCSTSGTGFTEVPRSSPGLRTSDGRHDLGRTKIPITVQIGAPLPPAEDITQTDAALRESMTPPLHRAQRCFPHPAGAHWVPRRLGGGAPSLAEAAQIEADEAAARAATRSAHPSG
jgi:hypothetical protein